MNRWEQRENHLVQMSSCQSRKSDCLYQKSINYSDNFLHFTLPLMGRRLTWAASFFARAAMREDMESLQLCSHKLWTLYRFSRSAATMPERSSGIWLLVQNTAAMREDMESSQLCLHKLWTLYRFSRSAATMPEHSSGISLLAQKGLSRSATRAKYWSDDNHQKRCYNHMVMKWRYLWFIVI